MVGTTNTAMRKFHDEQGLMNRKLEEANGSMLVVSQFTLCAQRRRKTGLPLSKRRPE
jgi:D-Tyr-tRNAtyr deacylase